MYSQADLENIKKMYARGVLEVREAGTWLKFQSMSEIRTAITDIEAEVTKSKPKGARIVRVGSAY